MKKIVSILLVFTLLLQLGACSKNETGNNETIKGAVESDLVPDYKHVEMEEYLEKIDSFSKAIDDNNVQEALSLYDDLYNELLFINDMDSVSYINYCIDSTSELWSGEYSYCEDISTEAEDKLFTVCNKFALSNMADDFKKHIDYDELFNDYVDYVPYSDELYELVSRESELVVEYMALDYYDPKYEDYCSQIFAELVPIRDKIAKAKGYENYALYADDVEFARDYSDDKLVAFYKAVKNMNYDKFRPYLNIISSNDIAYNVDGQQILKDIKTAIAGISDKVSEAYDYMEENNLCWFDNSAKNYATGYTLSFLTNDAPFIFNNLVGDRLDIYYSVHELGHFTNSYFSPLKNPLFNYGAYDLCEIQSQCLELLCANNISEVLNAGTRPGKYVEIANLVELMIKSCLYDEWQRTIYRNPDMTIEEMDQLYNELTVEYGLNPNHVDMSYQWRYISHNFESPMYYISYGTSVFAAFQIWLTSLSDFDLAISQYDKIVVMSADTIGYQQAIEETGLVMFDEYDKVLDIMNGIMDYLSDCVGHQK